MNKEKIQEDEYLIPYHYLDLVIEYYRDIFLYKYISKLNLIKEHISPKKTILDFGCGDGRLCYELKKTNKIEGMDISKKAIGFAKIINPELTFYNSNILNSNLNKKYDFILAIDVIEHIPLNKLVPIIEKLCFLLKPNGKIIISVPSKNVKLSEKHYQHFNSKSLENLLKKNFRTNSIIGFEKIGFEQTIYKFFIRFLLIVYPLRNYFPIIRKFITFTKKYYSNRISTGPLENAKGLLYIGTKI